MRKFLLILFLSALPASAQLVTVTGQVKDVNGIPYAGATMKAQLVSSTGSNVPNPTITISVLATCRANGFGSAPCNIPFTPSNGPFTLDPTGNIPGGGVSLQDNSLVTPALTQWQFSVNTSGNPPPLGTGPQVCSATVTITGVSQSISSSFTGCPALSNTGGTSLATAAPALNFSVSEAVTTRTGNTFPVANTGRFSLNATVINGSSNITILSTDSPFQCPGGVFPCSSTGSGSDFGLAIFCTNFTHTYPSALTSVVALPLGTITTVNSATSVTASTTGNANATGAATGACAWGPKESTALATAWAAIVSTCGATLELPGRNAYGTGPSVFLVDAAQFNVANSSPCAPLTDQSLRGWGLKGQGNNATYIVPTPDYSCATGTFGQSGHAQFFTAPTGMNVYDLTLSGLGNSAPTGTGCGASTVVTEIGGGSVGSNAIFRNVNWLNWGAGSGGLALGVEIETPNLNTDATIFQVGVGRVGVQVNLVGGSASSLNLYGLTSYENLFDNLDVISGDFTSTGGNYGTTGNVNGCLIGVGNGAKFTSHGDSIGQGVVSAVASFNGGICAGFVNGAGAAGSLVNISGSVINPPAATATEDILINNAGVNVVTAGQTTFQTTLAGTQYGVFNLGGGTFIETASNNFSVNTATYHQTGGPTNNAVFAHGMRGGCSGVATASQPTIAIRISGLTTAGAAVPTTCTGTTADYGWVADRPGTVAVLEAISSAAGSLAASGQITIFKTTGSGAATSQPVTCTFGTTTSCEDIAHSFSYSTGDRITATFSTQAGETLANVYIYLGPGNGQS